MKFISLSRSRWGEYNTWNKCLSIKSTSYRLVPGNECQQLKIHTHIHMYLWYLFSNLFMSGNAWHMPHALSSPDCALFSCQSVWQLFKSYIVYTHIFIRSIWVNWWQLCQQRQHFANNIQLVSKLKWKHLLESSLNGLSTR